MLLLACLLLAVALLALVLLDYYMFREIPPGPKGLPFIGLTPSQMDMKPLHLSYTKLVQQYGGLVSLRMGTSLTVIVGSASALKAVLFSKGAIFGHRPYRRSYSIRSKGQTGIGFCSYGDGWKQRRKVLHQSFFKGSVVTDLFEDKIHTNVDILLDRFLSAAETQEELNVRGPFRLETSNVISATLNGKQLQHDDQEFEMRRKFAELNGILQGRFTIGDYYPLLRRFTEDESAFQKFQELTDLEMAVHQESIDEHRRMKEESVRKARAGEGEELPDTDLQGILLTLQQQEKEQTGGNRLFDRDTLQVLSSETMAGGTDTQAATLEWFIVVLCNYPDVQKRLQEEVDVVLGGEKPVGEDRKRLVLLERVLHEVHRRWTILPLALPHSTDRDVYVEGYRIPKGTTVVPNQWALNHDPDVWPEPYTFNPDRFEGVSKQQLDNVMLSFGRGARVCPGKPLAQIQICIVLASLLQKFSFEGVLEEGQTKLDEDGVPGLIFFPKPFAVRVICR